MKLQPTEAWAVVGPDGKVLLHTLYERKSDSKLEADLAKQENGGRHTVQRVVITPKESA